MNSSNMSLKEGFDFLFENEDKSKKYEIIWNKDSVTPQNIKDCVAYILTTDIVVAAIKNEDEPLILKLLREPGISKDIDYAQGRTISFSILKNKVKSFQGFKTFYDISNDNVKNISVFNSIGQVYVQSVNQLVSSGATRMMLEAKQNVLKIDKARYLQMFRTFKAQSLIPKQKNQTKINFTKIFESISSRIENEGLLKTSSKEGKYEKDEKYTELSDHEKVYEASVYFFKKLSTDQKRGFGGKKKIEDFLNLLSSRKDKPVIDLARQFKESWNLTSKTVAKYIEKQFDEMINSTLTSESKEEVKVNIEKIAADIPGDDLTLLSPSEFDELLGQDTDTQPEDKEYDISVLLNGLATLVKSFEQETVKCIKLAKVYLSAVKKEGWTNDLLPGLERLVTRSLTLKLSYDSIKNVDNKLLRLIEDEGSVEEEGKIQKLSGRLERRNTKFKSATEEILKSLERLKDQDIEIDIKSSQIDQGLTTIYSLDNDEAAALKSLGVGIEDGADSSEVRDDLYRTFVPQGLDVSLDGDKLSSDAEDKSDKDDNKVASIIKEAQDLLSSVEKEEERIAAELSRIEPQNFTVSVVEKILKQLTEFANSISINNSLLMIISKRNKNFNKNATQDQKSELQDIIDQLNTKQQETADVIKGLTNDSKQSDSINNNDIESALATVAFDPNTVSRIDVSEIAPDINKDEVIAKAKSEFEDMKTQIGAPGAPTDGDKLSPDAGPDTIDGEIGDTVKDKGPARSEEESGEEVEEIDPSEIFQIQTALKEPSDEHNFMQNFGLITSFLYERHPEMQSDIEASLDGEKSIKDLKTLLIRFSDRVNKEVVMQSANSFDDTVDTNTLRLFNKSVVNLSKFGEKNIDGIIFESAAAQKYKITLSKDGFLTSIKSFISSAKLFKFQADVFKSPTNFELDFSYRKINSSTGNEIANSLNQIFVNNDDATMRVESFSEGELTLISDEFPENLVRLDFNDATSIIIELESESEETVDDTMIGMPGAIALIRQLIPNKEAETIIQQISDNAETLVSKNHEDLKSDLSGSGIDEDTANAAVEQIAAKEDLDQKKEETVDSVQALLEDKVIKRMSDTLYRDGGELINAIAKTSSLDFTKMREGDEQATINFKSSLAVQLNPNIDILKPMINDIFKGELTPIFDSLFLGREKFNEEKFKAAYSQLILSSFDKLVDIKQGRITEGLGDLMRKAGRAIKSGLANVTAMAPILTPVVTACYYALQTTIGATIFPYIMAGFGAWNIFSAIRDVKKFEEEKAKYRDNPLKYIEDSIFKDKKARKTIADIISHLTVDVVAARINPSYQVKRQNSGAGIVAGTSDWSKKLDGQLEEYSNLSQEDKAKAKIFNDRMIEQVKQTRYAKLGVISDGVVNEIFNEVMFGSKKIGSDVREKLFEGNIAQDEDALRQLAKSLHTAIAYSSVKNNFLKFLENRIRDASASFSKDSKRFGVELRDDQLDKNTKGRLGDVDKFEEYRKPFRAIQRNQQLFISPEQISEDFIGKLLVELTGMEQKEYNSLLAKAPTQFNENYIGGSLARLLFEDATAEEENKADQDKLEDERREANKQSNLTMPEAAGLGGINWAGSLYQTFYVDSLVSGSKSIFKSGFKVGTKKVASVNVTDSFCNTPFDANALNQMGFDPGHALIQGVNPYGGDVERIFFYYFDGAEGADKLSGILIKADGSCLELGHGKSLFGWFTKNAAWAKKFGVAVDAKKGTATAIGSGKSLAASSAEMKAGIVSMKTHLIGSYKAQVTAAQMKTNTLMLDNEIANVADLLDNQGHVTPDTFNDIYEALHKTWSQAIEATGETPNFTPVEQLQVVIDNINAKIDAASRTSPKMWDAIKRGMEDYVNDADVKAADQALSKAETFYLDNVRADVDMGAVTDQTQSAKQALLAAQEKAAAVKATAFKVHMGKISASEMKLLSKEVILKATGSTAQAGFNPILDVSVQSVNKTVSFLQKMSPIKIGDTSTLEKIATIALKSDAAVIAASKVIGPVGLLGKVCAKFFKRGIKGGTFAEQFYKVFKPQQLVYSDMLYAICGAEVPGRSKVNAADSNGGMISTLSNVNDQSNNNTGVQITSMPTEITSNDASNNAVEENYVYKNSLSDYLFENKTVTKKKKISKISSASLSLNEEFEAHSHLKDLFKKLV